MNGWTATWIGALGMALAAAGCGGAQANYRKVELIAAGGTVTLDGEPLVGATVVFESPDGQFSAGVTGPAGGYRLEFDSVRSGVTPGPKTVRISTSRRILGLNEDETLAAAGEQPAGEFGERLDDGERVPARYHVGSELTVVVDPGRTVYDFQLHTP